MFDIRQAAHGRPTERVRAFLRSEDGGATIWNLTWLLGFAVMAGVSIDSTNGWRNKTMSQSTADVAVLAAAMDIPNPERQVPYAFDGYESAKDAALLYADKNLGMDAHEFGGYLARDDIEIGRWDVENRTWTAGPDTDPVTAPVNAVRLNNVHNDTRSNGVPMQVLGTIGWSTWDVQTAATAITGVPKCFFDGIVAGDTACVRTDNTFYPGFCVYGDQGLSFQTSNLWYPGAAASSPPDALRNIRDGNTGLVVVDEYRTIPMVEEIPEITHEILQGGSHMALPAFTGGEVIRLTGTSIGTQASGEPQPAQNSQDKCDDAGGAGLVAEPMGTYDVTAGVVFDDDYGPTGSTLAENRIYYYDGTDAIHIGGELRNVVIVTHDRIKIHGGARLENVTLVSLYEGDDYWAVELVQDAQMGVDDDCVEGGGVRVFAQGGVHSASHSTWYGAQVVSGGNIHLASAAEGIRGIAVYAAGNASVTTHNSFGSAEEAGIVDPNASCLGGVDVAFTDSVYEVRLVE